MSRHARLLLLPLILVLLALSSGRPAHAQASPDPVKDLSEALDRGENLEVLKKHIAQLKSIPELLEAAHLAYIPAKSYPEPVADLLKVQVHDRLRSEMEKVVKARDNDVARLALAVLMGETTTAQSRFSRLMDKRQYAAFIRSLSGYVEQLVTEEPLPHIRQAAVQALAKIPLAQGGDRDALSGAITAMKSMFRPDRTATDRWAAAEALAEMVRTHERLAMDQSHPLFGAIDEPEALLVVGEAVPVAGLGMSYPDAKVRFSSLKALHHATKLLENLEILRVSPTPAKVAWQLIESSEAMVMPVLSKVNDVIKSTDFVATLTGADPAGQLLSLRVLENLATIRLRLKMRRESAEAPPNGKIPPLQDPLREGLEKAVKHFTANLSSPDPAIRLAATEFLERMGDLSAGAVNELTARLGDTSPFVRWAAVRALARIGYLELNALGAGEMVTFRGELVGSVVDGLATALCDRDLDVRVAAADTISILALTAYAAKSPDERTKAVTIVRQAVPELTRAVQVGDRNSRVAVLRALRNTGVPAGEAPNVTQVLIGVLAHPDPKVRQAAAETLGTMGSAAAAATDALTAALNDPDDNVRRTASDALLKIKR